MIITATTQGMPEARVAARRSNHRRLSDRLRLALRLGALAVGAFVFLFPFYYMVMGSFQTHPDTSIRGAVPKPGNLTLDNYGEMANRIPLGHAFLSSGIFAAAVIGSTLLIGIPAGYALAQLHFRGRGLAFGVLILVQVVPFQLLMIPLYVLIVRDYGLADSYLGIILPFAVNATAVFIFRQFFLTVPRDLFDAARIDGASELKILLLVALPLVRPALLTVILITFIQPWNEFLWPFLVTKNQNMQPLAVALANYISSKAGGTTNYFGTILAGAVVLAVPVVILFVIFQKRFASTDLSTGMKG